MVYPCWMNRLLNRKYVETTLVTEPFIKTAWTHSINQISYLALLLPNHSLENCFWKHFKNHWLEAPGKEVCYQLLQKPSTPAKAKLLVSFKNQFNQPFLLVQTKHNSLNSFLQCRAHLLPILWKFGSGIPQSKQSIFFFFLNHLQIIRGIQKEKFVFPLLF